MGVLDFLTEGQPIAAQPYASTTQAVLPDWYTNYAMNVLAQQQAVAARPFALFPGQRIAEFTPDQQAAFDATRQGAFSFRPDIQTAGQAATGAVGRSSLGAAQPLLGEAAGMSGVSAAQPFMAAAGQTVPGVVSSYMNPYTDAVVNRIGELGTRTLKEQVLPGISDEMIRAGQFGGTRQAEITGRAIRDAMEGISAQQSQALQQGFGQAQTAAQADLSRMGSLAATAGGLTQAQQQILAQLGGTTGNLYGADTEAALRAAGALSEIGKTRQQLELGGAGALEAAGATQQGQVQRNLDLAQSDFEKQFAYPQQQIGALTQTLGAVAPAIPKAQTVQGYGSENATMERNPSPLAQIGGTATALAALSKALGIKF